MLVGGEKSVSLNLSCNSHMLAEYLIGNRSGKGYLRYGVNDAPALKAAHISAASHRPAHLPASRRCEYSLVRWAQNHTSRVVVANTC